MQPLRAFLYSAAAPILILTLAANPQICAVPQAIGVSAQALVPSVAFCEMVRNPERYFDKTVRLTARLQLTDEAQYLSDENCPLSHDEQIGVGYVDGSKGETDLHNKELTRIRSMEFGSRANVSVVGVLRNSSMRAFAWYHYRFEIIRFEEVSHVIVPYEGTLQAAVTYRAVVHGDRHSGLSLVEPLRPVEYQAVRIEWTNISEFPALKRLYESKREVRIVFSVVSNQNKQMTAQRWNRTIRCKIISVGSFS